MFLADSTGSRRRVGVAIAAALDSYFPKCEKLSLIFYSAGRCQKTLSRQTSESESEDKNAK
jgi:hypothetical protein